MAGPTRSGFAQQSAGTAAITVTTGDIPAGSWMIAAHVFTSSSVPAAPAGWRVLMASDQIGSRRWAIYGKIRGKMAADGSLDASDAGRTSYVFTASVAAAGRAAVFWGTGAKDVADWVVGVPRHRNGIAIPDTNYESIYAISNSVTSSIADSLVLNLAAEASSGAESAVVGVSGATEWVFFPQGSGANTSAIETIHASYIEKAAPGATGVVTVTYPNSQPTNAGAVQIILPPVAGVVVPTISYSLIGTSRPNRLGIGAKIANAAGGVHLSAVPTATPGATPILGPTAIPAASGFVYARVTGLADDTEYTVQLVDNPTGAVIDTLYAKTFASVQKAFMVGTSSCQQNTSVGLLYNQIDADNPDFFVHQGDLHYRDAQTEALWLQGTNDSLSGANMKAFLKRTHFIYGWDNHDWGGNKSYKDSPAKNWAPARIRELLGTETYTDPVALYETWTHGGVRFIQTDQWSSRDEADPGNNETDWLVGKSMLGNAQREWLFDTWENSTEAIIVWFCSFPLYGNWLRNGRWGNFRWEAQQIQDFLDTHPDVKRRLVCVGGDSHNVVADSGANTMWGLPSLNASPIDRNGDPNDGQTSGVWNIANLQRGMNSGYYSRLSFSWPNGKPRMLWEAVEHTGDVVASHVFVPATPSTQPWSDLRVGNSQVQRVYAGGTLAWQR